MLQMTAIIISLVSCRPANAQICTEPQVCDTLSGYMRALHKDGYGFGSDTTNRHIHDYLLNASVHHPELLAMPLGCLDTTGLTVLTSSDKKFRIYVWDQFNGGTMHFYDGLIQYASGPGKTAAYSLLDTGSVEDGGGTAPGYSQVRTLRTKSGKTVYLAFSHSQGSTIDLTAGIEAYTVENGQLLASYPFFHTKTKQFGEISYYYNMRETTDFDWNNLPEITLSPDNKILTIPVVTEDGKVTKGKLVYVFDGERFVFRKK